MTFNQTPPVNTPPPLNTEAARQLERVLNFNTATLNLIKGSAAFVNAINLFFKNPGVGIPRGSFKREEDINEGSYNPYSKELNIRPDMFNVINDDLPGIQFKALTILAHELGHALSGWQYFAGSNAKDDNDNLIYSSLSDYVTRMHEEEGRAAYSQFMLIRSLNIPDASKRDLVQYLTKTASTRQELNLYDQLNDAILYDGTNALIYRPLQIIKD